MGDSFFECPLVWLCSLCVLALVLLARCEERCPSSRDRRTRSCYAEAPALRSSAPTVLVVAGLVVLLVAAVWLLE